MNYLPQTHTDTKKYGGSYPVIDTNKGCYLSY